MYILPAPQMGEWDRFTIQNEPVSPLDLMERAARRCFEWIVGDTSRKGPYVIFCGKGNNGGDGLAIARMLLERGYHVTVHVLESGQEATEEFLQNLQRLHTIEGATVHYIQSSRSFPSVFTDVIVVDALFGSGLNRPLDGIAALLAEHINTTATNVIAIDLPSGIFADTSSKGNIAVRADHTLTFQTYKTALLIQENAAHIGNVHVLDIGLHPGFLDTGMCSRFFITDRIIAAIFKDRDAFAHKGHFGHALIAAGSFGKIGAAVLSARACLRSGAGMLTCYLPACGYSIMQTAAPEAMVETDDHARMLTRFDGALHKYAAIGIGPGIGTSEETQSLVSFFVQHYSRPMVIDADALNCLALNKELMGKLPAGTILTPHPKEFDRMFGEHANDFERLETAHRSAQSHGVVIVLKSHHTLVATMHGQLFFNSTGNSGMAKGGSGDVLTGILTSLLAQGYAPEHAGILGVYLHGLAGDFAANALTEQAMLPTDIITFLAQAFGNLQMAQ